MFRRALVVRALAFCAAAGLVVTAQEPAAAVSLAIINGRIYTMDASRPWAEAIAITGERIVAVGSTRTFSRWRARRASRFSGFSGFCRFGFRTVHAVA